MSDDIVRVLEEQEARLRFPSLDLECIERVCREAESILEKLKAPCYIRAAVNGTVVHARCLPGASLNGGKSLESCGMDSADFGFSGGSFPILLPSGICVGSLTISGLRGEEDHQIAAESIARVLGADIGTVVPYFSIPRD